MMHGWRRSWRRNYAATAVDVVNISIIPGSAINSVAYVLLINHCGCSEWSYYTHCDICEIMK